VTGAHLNPIRVLARASASPSGVVILGAGGVAAAAAFTGSAVLVGVATSVGLTAALYRFARQEARFERIMERNAAAARGETHRAEAELSESLRAVVALAVDHEERLIDAAQQIEEIRTELATKSRAARNDIDTTRRRIQREVARERSQRISGVARALTSGRRPDKLLLIIATHRAGSTLLLDLIRSIEGVGMWPSAEWWDRLGLEGRRYPGDLSDDADGTRELEVQPGQGSLVPELRDRYASAPIAVEKLHPEFFGYDHAAFAARLVDMRRELPTEVVYLARRPLDAMWSMAEYKSRNPDWYAHLDVTQVPELIRRSLRTMLDLSETSPGVVFDYEQLIPADASLARELAPLIDATTEALEPMLRRAHDSLRSDSRPGNRRGVFVGRQGSPRPEEGPDGAWSELAETMAAANSLYSRIRETA
jgi:hypothetical protein